MWLDRMVINTQKKPHTKKAKNITQFEYNWMKRNIWMEWQTKQPSMKMLYV